MSAVRFCNGCEKVYPKSCFQGAQRRCKACRTERTAERLETLRNDPFIAAVIRETPRGEDVGAWYRALVAQGLTIRAIAVHVELSSESVSRAMKPGRVAQYKNVRRALGLCADCGRSSGEMTRCPKHRAEHAAREARRRASQ